MFKRLPRISCRLGLRSAGVTLRTSLRSASRNSKSKTANTLHKLLLDTNAEDSLDANGSIGSDHNILRLKVIGEQGEHTKVELLGNLAAEGVEELDGVCLQQGNLGVRVRLKRGKNVGLEEVADIDEAIDCCGTLLVITTTTKKEEEEKFFNYPIFKSGGKEKVSLTLCTFALTASAITRKIAVSLAFHALLGLALYCSRSTFT